MSFRIAVLKFSSQTYVVVDELRRRFVIPQVSFGLYGLGRRKISVLGR